MTFGSNLFNFSIKNHQHYLQVAFFLANFQPLATHTQDFCEKKKCQSYQILRNFFSQIAIFRQWVPAVRQNMPVFLNFSSSFLDL
jgi:hypothetical protein